MTIMAKGSSSADGDEQPVAKQAGGARPCPSQGRTLNLTSTTSELTHEKWVAFTNNAAMQRWRGGRDMTAKATSRPASASHEAPFSFRWFLRVCTKEFAARVTAQRITAAIALLVERRRIPSMPAAREDLTQIWFIGFGPAALGCPRSRPEVEIWQQHNYLCEEQCLKTVAEERLFFGACF